MKETARLSVYHKLTHLTTVEENPKLLSEFLKEQSKDDNFNINTENIIGPPIMEAANLGRWEHVKILFNNNADINVKNRQNGWSFVHEAILNAPDNLWEAIVEEVEAGEVSTINSQDKIKKKTPLMVAYEYDKYDRFCQLLNVEAGRINFKLQDKEGNSIAHIVAMKNDIPTLNLLLEKNIPLDIVNKNGLTVVDMIQDPALKNTLIHKITARINTAQEKKEIQKEKQIEVSRPLSLVRKMA